MVIQPNTTYNNIKSMPVAQKVTGVEPITTSNDQKSKEVVERAIKFMMVDGIPVVRFKDDDGEVKQIPTDEALKNKRIANYLNKIEQDLFRGSLVNMNV
jgi:hypothetical protein